MTDRSEYLELYLEEMLEHLDLLGEGLITLEKGGADVEVINSVYRAVHTVKGGAQVVGVGGVGALAHAMEDLLDRYRANDADIPSEHMDLLFAGLKTLQAMAEDLTATGKAKNARPDLIRGLAEAIADTGVDGDQVSGSAPDRYDHLELSGESEQAVREVIDGGSTVFEVDVTFEVEAQLKQGRAYQIIRALEDTGKVIAVVPDLEEVDDTTSHLMAWITSESEEEEIRITITGITGVATCQVTQVDAEAAPTSSTAGTSTTHNLETVRVKRHLLDELLDLMGEALIHSIRIQRLAEGLDDRELQHVLKTNARLLADLQNTVLDMRMVPTDAIFRRFPRMVRDMAHERNREVDFAVEGQGLEIDRSILDGIVDALMHLLRNAVDHGIENPDERVAAGKPATGTLRLHAAREKGSIRITIRDDGRGMDAGVIAAKAIEQRLVSKEELEGWPTERIIDLVFRPGFTTAKEVTETSGRGVGLDVVRTSIEGLGGSVRLDTTLGQGTTFTLNLPPSVAIIRAMLVEVGTEKYAIPLEQVRETIRIPLDSLHSVGGDQVFKLREEVIRIRDIGREFGGAGASGDSSQAVVVEKDSRVACLLVTGLIGQQEIVVKRLSRGIQNSRFYSGCTILGDGKVAMILDVGAFV